MLQLAAVPGAEICGRFIWLISAAYCIGDYADQRGIHGLCAQRKRELLLLPRPNYRLHGFVIDRRKLVELLSDRFLVVSIGTAPGRTQLRLGTGFGTGETNNPAAACSNFRDWDYRGV